ncbi:hypothetical protein Val02_64520 [Virgisporangium aliadipatigenens]|uniref:Uncharacterized protein n=1 Tax=Virgisporangium aliadipatigenens TaxID=741659 RepID=A0A8J3YTJ8_9ACTN|nr:hypothetical protein [Virgisporangium aliadipatigenens]GIJ49566.1 hypothetical protein Val02_64520 [Virgisporangium aliadipatigenens]
MNSVLEPPAERDLPPGHRERMRQSLLREIDGGRDRRPRRPLVPLAALAGAAVLIAAVVMTTTGLPWNGDSRTDVRAYAYRGGVVPQDVRRTADRCLADNDFAQRHDDPRMRPEAVVGDLELVNYVSRNGTVAVYYLADNVLVACLNQPAEDSRSIAVEPLGDWLPGAVQIDGGVSEHIDGGGAAFSVLGRVAPGVHRVVLEHGDGLTTEANVLDGTFVVIADGPVRPGRGSLVSYDSAGTVLDRRPAWAMDQKEPRPCYTDPAGTVVVGSGSTGCGTAERWRR